MPDFKILDVFEKDCNMVVLVEHYQSDDSFWFTEYYIWQGVQGTKFKRVTNAEGDVLMDDGNPAPWSQRNPDEVIKPGAIPAELVQTLPPDREWLRETTPWMDNESILGTIRSTHNRRTETGWPVQHDELPSFQLTERNAEGCTALINKFAALKDYSE